MMKFIVLLRVALEALQIERLAALVVDLVGALLDADDLLGERVELVGIAADIGEQRHRLEHELCRLHHDLAHLLHLRLEAFHLEQGDGLGGLVHLVDGIVERVDQILDVGAVERGDEGAAHGGQHLARDLVGLRFALENDLAIMLDAVAALEQSVQRLGARDDNGGMPHEELEEPLLLRHQRLEPAEHRGLASRENRCAIIANA